MTTAHVSAAMLSGPPPTETEVLDALSRVFERHPLLSACVRGKSNHYIPDAQPYPMHSDYINRAFFYNSELYKPEPNTDIQRFEPSPLAADELARRALQIVPVEGSDALEAAWRGGFDDAMDGTVFDEDGDGPLWRLTLYSSVSSATSALLYQANHAVSDQLSFNLLLSEVLEAIAAARAGSPLPPPARLPLPPSVEGALLGPEQRQNEEIKARLELIIGRFVDGVKLPFSDLPSWAPKALPAWEPGRVTLSTIKYGLWQAAASGAKVLPRWAPRAQALEASAAQEAAWEHRARRTRNVHRSVDADTVSALVKACRARGITVSGVLCAAAVLGSSDSMGTLAAESPGEEAGEEVGEEAPAQERYKLLQALDMRTLAFREGEAEQPGARDDWSGGTVLAGTGSLDILVDLPPSSSEAVRGTRELDVLWSTAAECNRQTRSWIEQGWGRESLLLFSCGWEFMNMNRVVELGSQDRTTLGRAYSAGVSNVGRYAHPDGARRPQAGGLH